MDKQEKNLVNTGTAGLSPQHWVHKYADYLYRFAMTRINDDDELAKDLVQETFLSALEKLNNFEGRCSEKTWLTSILKYKIIEIYRSNSSSVKCVKGSEPYSGFSEFFQQHDGHWRVEKRPKEFAVTDTNIAENKEFRSLLQQCMKKLPALWMNIFKMKFIDEELTPVICDELKISSANYWVIIHRAKVNLRACLQKNWS